VDRSRAHDGGKVQPVRQRIEPFQSVAAENTHPAGRVQHALASQGRDQPAPQPVTHSAHQRHLASGSRTPRAHHEISALALLQRSAQRRQVLRWIGAIRIQKRQPIATGRRKARLERTAIAPVCCVLHQPDTRVTRHDGGRAIHGSVIDHQDFQASGHLGERGADGKHPFDDRTDAVLFVIGRDNHREHVLRLTGICCVHRDPVAHPSSLLSRNAPASSFFPSTRSCRHYRACHRLVAVAAQARHPPPYAPVRPRSPRRRPRSPRRAPRERRP